MTHDSLFPPFLTLLTRCSPLTLAALLFTLALVTFSWRLGEGPICRTMEGREALVMQEIARSGNWILPLRNGETIPSKPPLLHWLGVAVARLSGGVSEWSVRFPCALFSALSVALICMLGCRLANREVGVLAGLLFLTMPGVVEMAREGWVDPALSFFVLAALAGFISMYEDDLWRGWRSIVFALALAGGVLSKGPVGYIIPAVVIFLYLAVQGRLACLRQLLTLPVILLAIGLPLVWYLLAVHQGGEAFLQKQVLQENFLRFTSGSGKRIPSTTFFFVPFFRDAFPWSILSGVAVWNFSRHAPVREKGVFPLLWIVAVVSFFSISAGKREVYLLPTYPAVALFTAEWGWPLLAAHTRAAPDIMRITVRFLMLGMVSAVVIGAVLAACGWLTLETAWIDSFLGQNKWDTAALYIRFFAEHPVYGLGLCALLGAGSLWAVFAATAGRWQTALWALLCCLLLSTLGIYPFTRAYSKEFKALTGFAAAIRQTVSPGAPLFFYTPEPYSSEFDEFSQLYYYLDRHVPLASCAEQPDLSRCPPGYYVIRQRHWQSLPPAAHVQRLLDSADSAGPDARMQLVLVHLGV